MGSFYGNYGIGSGGGTGTTDYNELTNKPKIDGEELVGDLNLEEKYALKGECSNPIWEDFSKNLEEDIVKNRLILFYNFSELRTVGTQTVIDDLSGHGNDGILYGEGYDLNHLSLVLPGGDAGSNAPYVELPQGFFDNKELLTITMWIKDNVGAGNYSAFYIGNDRNAQYFLLNPINPSNKLKVVIADNNNPNEFAPYLTEVGSGSTNAPTEGPDVNSEWNFFAVTLTAAEMVVYMNGVKYNSYPLAYGGVPAFGQNLLSYIGKSLYPDPIFNGEIKDFRVYEKVLTDEKIKDIYSVGTYGTYVPVDYNSLINKPSIDGVELSGDISLKDKYATKDEIGSLILSYDFEKIDFDNGNAIIRDVSGNNNDAYIKGTGYSIYDSTVELPGGLADSDAAYIELSRGVFNGKKNITFSIKAKNLTANGNYSLFFVGSDMNPPTNYVLLDPKDIDGRLKAAITNDVNVVAPWETEIGPGTLAFPEASPLMDDDWHIYTLTITPDLFSVYLDGKLWNKYPLNRSISDFEDELVSYIGRSSYPDEFFKGRIKDFKAYNGALTDDKVNDLYLLNVIDESNSQFKYGLEPVVHYKTNIFEDKLIDETGHGFDATLVNLDQYDVKEKGSYKYIDFYQSDGYIQLPPGIIRGEEFSISCTFKSPRKERSALWTIGTDLGNNYIGLHPFATDGITLEVVKDGSFNGTTYEKVGVLEYVSMVVSFHKNGIADVFLNGAKIGTLDYGCSIQNIISNSLELEPNFLGYIGKSSSNDEDPLFNGRLIDFAVYDYIISPNLLIDEKYALKQNTIIIGTFSQNRDPESNIGEKSFAEGEWCNASGIDSHAEGYYSEASEEAAHAEGEYTVSSGIASHAEGMLSEATGDDSHAEGFYSNASGENSHAEGEETLASGITSHAEGGSTQAIGSYSHAEGYFTKAEGAYSHAEGGGTSRNNYLIASGDYSHAEGRDTKSTAYDSHAEGLQTIASGNHSHSEGADTEASGESSHAEGDSTIASGDGSHAEGSSTTASGIVSHAEGGETQATEMYAHAEGTSTEASGKASHAEGSSTQATGNYSHAEGYESKALDTMAAHAEGTSTTASGMSAHAEGYLTTSSSMATHAEGYDTTASALYAHAEGSSTKASGKSSHAEGTTTKASGDYSHAEGSSTIASGIISHAEGGSTEASGQYSHAEGEYTVASGDGSHAAGISAIASGNFSHAEGDATEAKGYCSHAEGSQTEASGNYSHAEGLFTVASGECSHAEGYGDYSIKCEASGDYSHAEGRETTATGECAHSEGSETIASGECSHAEGTMTKASGNRAHAEGNQSKASGNYSHAEGFVNETKGSHSHAEGYLTITEGESSHTEGYFTKTTGYYSHAEGERTTASGNSSHAEGKETEAVEAYAHAEGVSTHATGQYSHTEGSGTTASGERSHAEGFGTKSSGIGAHSEGEYTIASGDRAHAEGHSATASGKASHAEGNQSETSSDYSHAEGYFTITEGECSHTEGYRTTASGKYSHAEGKSSNSSSNTVIASGEASHAEGFNTKAEGECSHAEGASTKASGSYSHSEGEGNTANGNGAHAEGGGTKANGAHSHTEGYYTVTSETGLWAHAEGDSTEASGQNSHAEGEKTKATGRSSHAEGYGFDNKFTVASGNYSHAEGRQTTATEECAHSEGSNTIAEGRSSHAEGYTTKTTGMFAHAEGYNTEASGQESHAEGFGSIASSEGAHAEGYYTKAQGLLSHSEGNNTIAAKDYQHVEGMFNIEDTDTSERRGKYLHIAGNGKDDENRSNAYTLDWKGNAEFQGDVTANGCGGASPISLVELAAKVEDLVQKWNAAANGDEVSY